MSRVPSLLSLSYRAAKEIRFEDLDLVNDNCYAEIYGKVVEEARNKIKCALRNQMKNLILKSIYLFRTEDPETAANYILSDINNYDKSIWRLALYYSVSSYVLHDKNQYRILDLMNLVDTIINYNDVTCRDRINSKLEIVDAYIKNNKETDLMMYINLYSSIGSRLLPP